MNRINTFIAVFFFLAGAALYLATPSQVSQVSTAPATLGADFFPKFIAVLMLVSSAGLFIQSRLAIRQGYESEEKPDCDWRRESKVAVVMAMMIAYILLMPAIGFILSTTAFGVALLFLLGDRAPGHYAVYILCVGVIYWVFKHLLYVHLPELGVWIL